MSTLKSVLLGVRFVALEVKATTLPSSEIAWVISRPKSPLAPLACSPCGPTFTLRVVPFLRSRRKTSSRPPVSCGTQGAGRGGEGDEAPVAGDRRDGVDVAVALDTRRADADPLGGTRHTVSG